MLKILPGKLILLFYCVFLFEPAKAQDTTYSLEECIKLAFENNLNVQRGKLDVESSRIDLNQSKMSRLPDLNIGSGYSRSWGRSINSVTNEFETVQRNSVGLNASSNMSIFNGFQISNSIKQSIVELEAGNADLEKVKNDVALSVANLYLNVIFNSELQSNAEVQLQSTQEQLDRTIKLVDVGSLPLTNQLNLQAQLATNEVDLVNAQNNYSLAVLQLKQALLLPANDPFEIEVPDFDLELIEAFYSTANEVYNSALGNQPDVKSADLRIRSADLGAKISRSAYLPSLTFSAGVGSNWTDSPFSSERAIFEGTEIVEEPFGYLASDPNEIVFSRLSQPRLVGVDQVTFSEQIDENLNQSINLNLAIPVFNRWRTKSDVQRSIIFRQRAELNAAEVRNNLRQDIETAYNNYVASLKSFTASEKQVNALQESFRIVDNQ